MPRLTQEGQEQPEVAGWPGPDLAEPAGAILDAQQRLGLGALLRLGEPVPAEPGPPASPTATGRRSPAATRRRGPAVNRRRSPAALWRRSPVAVAPLVAILVVQAVLSLRLIWSRTAFQDEGLYLWAGHLEIAHWLHGTPVPPFATYFSGAPVIYPPVGALADSVGGLAAARGLSLIFMLGATALLWRSAGRLFGNRAAFFAAGLFALLGLTLHAGAFATLDAPAVLLVALSAWCAVTASRRDDDATGWMAASAVALALANAAAYPSVIFDPVVILLATLASLTRTRQPQNSQPKNSQPKNSQPKNSQPKNSQTGQPSTTQPRTSQARTKLAARRGAALFAYTTALIIVGVTIGGGSYLVGIGQALGARAYSPVTVLETAGRSAAPLAILAALGTVLALASRSPRSRRLIPPVLLGALLLLPAESARTRALTSLDRHADIGAWFAAIAAGYAADRLITWLRPRAARVAATLATAGMLVFPARMAVAQAASLTKWPDAAGLVTALAPIVAPGGRLLVEEPAIAEYYLPAGRQWRRWSNTRSIVLPGGRGLTAPADVAGAAALYGRYIARGYFSVVALNFADTGALDRRIAEDLAGSRSYLAVATIPYGAGDYIVWQRALRRPTRRPLSRAARSPTG